uniref:Uncharacterized protein n=1 Tax=Arundo donax TaxID=35708 RepID=A0A0A9BLU1_ARUDO
MISKQPSKSSVWAIGRTWYYGI